MSEPRILDQLLSVAKQVGYEKLLDLTERNSIVVDFSQYNYFLRNSQAIFFLIINDISSFYYKLLNFDIIFDKLLKDGNHNVRVRCLHLIGCLGSPGDDKPEETSQSEARTGLLTLLGQYANDIDPRVRETAYEAIVSFVTDFILPTILRFAVKGTHTVYFSSSLYIINQKPILPRTHFHCITTWVVRLLGEIRPCICLLCGFGLLARWRYYPI